MKKRILSLTIAVLASMSLFWSTPLAEGEMSYVDTDGTLKNVTEYTVIDSETQTLTDGWYAATGTVTVNERLQISGEVHLILCDGATLMAVKGVHVSGSNSLTVWGQIAGSGELTVEKPDTYNAGIGGDRGETDGNGGSITINGGTVTVNGSALAAGIGSGIQGKTGTITVNGGMVYASGGFGAAGIGSSYQGFGGTITVNGGTVIGKGGDGVEGSCGAGAGIGGSDQGAGCDAAINGGVIFAIRGGGNGGEAIGCGEGGTDSGSLTLYEDAEVFASLEAQEPVSPDARLGACRGGFVKITPRKDPVSYAEPDGTVKSVRNYLTLEGTEVYLVPGWYALTQDLTYEHRIQISGDVHLILGDGFTLKANRGVQLASDNSLTVWSQSEGTGTLTAEGGDWNNAAIGGGGGGSSDSDLDAGSLTVNGGVITANGYGGAGIGGGSYEEWTGENELMRIGGQGGTVLINGGTVTAAGSSLAAGIGGSDGQNGGPVTINGGTVSATGGEGAAGIGGGHLASSDPITINGGTVTAIGGREASGIGGGMWADGCTVTITGGAVNAIGGSEYNYDDSFASASGQGGAGIGGGMTGNGGNVTITGGVVSATGGSGGAGIGGGSGNCVDFSGLADKKGGDGGQVTVTGGYVIACGGISNPNEHGHSAPGIGGGARATNYYGTYVDGGAGADVEIRGGTVIAIAGSDSVEAIGHAENSSNSGSLSLYDGAVVYASPEAAKPVEQSVEIGACRGVWVRITADESPVSYLYPDGTNGTLQKNYTRLNGAGAGILTGWYVVTENTVYENLMTVFGDANIILCDGVELKTRGINVDEGNSLTIWSQAEGTGALTSIARPGDNAAIGSGHVARYPYDSGAITINGGRITADATQSRGAGIGGTILRSNGTVMINGGTVTAVSTYGAGIGGGHAGGGGGTVIINGGSVTASSYYGAGIGGGRGTNGDSGHYSGGDGGNITINGGIVTATGGWWAAGIGGATGTGDSSSTEDGGAGGTVTITGGEVYAYGANRAAGIGGANGAAGGTVTITGGTVTAVRGGSRDAESIGHGEHAADSGSLTLFDEAEVYASADAKEPVDEENRLDACRGAWAKVAPPKSEVSYVDTDGTEKSVKWYGVLSETDTALTDGWYVLTGDTVCSSRIRVSGDVKLILADGTHLTAESGLTVADSNSLTIFGQTEQTGALTATGGGFLAGIGGEGNQAGGTITIAGGVITAVSVSDGAAIGGGANGGGGTIAVIRGTVTADASGGYGAGIGGGGATSGKYTAGDGGTVTISGGTVTASGGFWAAGIGGGTGTGDSNATTNGGNGGVVTINGGEVYAYGANRAAGIGGANGSAGGTVIINGGTVIAVRGGSRDAEAVGHGERSTDSGSLTLYDDAWVFSSETADTPADWQERASVCRGAWVRVAPGMACVSYVDADGAETKCNDYTVLTGAESVLSEGWYVLVDDQTYSDRLETNGDVKLILGDGAVLKAVKGVNVAGGSSLILYGQSGQTGKLNVSGPDANDAGIGGGEGQDAGTVTINGGIVTCSAGTDAAGIGGSAGQASGTVVINGGKITVLGGTRSAAIGKGSRGTGGAVTINGGTVIANGSGYGAGIGGGNATDGGVITITGGTVTSTGGTYSAAIGGGGSGAGGTIRIEGGTVKASVSREEGQAIGHGVESEDSGSLSLSEEMAVFDQILAPSSVAQDRRIDACRGNWVRILSNPAATTFVDEDGNGRICNNFTLLSGTETTLSSGWYVVTGQMENTARITVSGDVCLILEDGADFTAPKGITVAGTNSLTIYGQSAQSGKLTVTAPGNYYAGIGGGSNQNSGVITINGGVIEATGGLYGAGIGGGYGTGTNGGGEGGVITITGGTVIASGGDYGAGIGGGTGSANVAESGSGGVVTITGGTVIATGGNGGTSARGGAGIGGGYNGNGGEITISGGSVTAIAGSNAEAVGHGWNSEESGTLTLGAVKGYASGTDAQPAEAAQRETVCRSLWVKLESCDHTDVLYTDNGDGTHTASCRSCGEEIATEEHSFTGYVCVCGAEDLPIKIIQQPADVSVPLGGTASTTVVAEGEGLTYQWYGREANGREFTSGLKSDTYSVSLILSKAGRQVWCVITDRDGNTVTTRTATLNLELPEGYSAPCITAQPVSAEAEPGETVSVSFTAEGDTELTYQWYFSRNGGETWVRSSIRTDTYTVEMNASRQGRQLYCVVTDLYGGQAQTDTVTIDYAWPEGYTGPHIVMEPVSAKAAPGEIASVTVEADGQGELRYQWYIRNAGSEVWKKSSTKTDTYAVEMNVSRNGRSLYCVVTDKYGLSVQSGTVTIGFDYPEGYTGPQIVSEPSDVSIGAGELASTGFLAEGEGLTYQWYLRADEDAAWSRSSLTGDTYYVTMVARKSGRQVKCVVTDKYGSKAETRVATLTMVQPADYELRIVSQPEDCAVARGQRAEATFAVEGAGLTYRWYCIDPGQTEVWISGIRSATYGVTMVPAKSGRVIYCVVTDAYGNTVTSDPVTLSIA